MRKLLLTYIILHIFIVGYSQAPANYYNNASGKSGANLKTALFQIIKSHTKISYTSLWTAFQTTDAKSNGKVWDMYSDVPGGTPSYTFTFITKQCGNDGYSVEGDCYNREHSFPKSWWGGGTDTMYTDLFHLVPTDGKVNGQRSSFPFGEVGTATWTSTNGCKLGPSNYPGYTSTVFEPIDEYKGDFARNYFYMATRYQNKFDNWAGNTDMLDGDGFSDWALAMLLDWHNQDPVSTKETDRNDDVYSIQNNRNPFIDHPEYVAQIWGGTDAIAPSFNIGSPSSDNIDSTEFDLVVNLSEACDVYYVLLVDGSTAPSVSQVKAGQNASNTLLASGLKGTISVTSSSTNFVESISTLTKNASYDVYLVAEDASYNIQSSVSLLEVALSPASSGGSGGVIAATYSENFDINGNWVTTTSYEASSYTLSSPQYNDYFSSNLGLKDYQYSNSASNTFRLDDVAGAYLRYECEGTVSSFSIMAARWDNSPTPNITVRYSTNSGSSYSTATTLTGSFFSGDKIYKQISHTFSSPITNDSGNKIYIEFLTTSGERMLYDDFEINFGAAAPAYDNESDMVIKDSWTEPTNIAYDNYSETSNLTTSNSIEVAKFTIRDGGSDLTDIDTEGTTLTDISFTIDNYENIKALALFKGSTKVSEITSVSNTATFASISIVTADEDSEDISLYATFNTDATDNDNLKFTINSVTADNSIGSDFATSNAGGAYTDNSGDNNKIEVTATKLSFTANKPASSVSINTDFDVEVKALDDNNNIDLDANNSISIAKTSGSGTLSSITGETQYLVNGIFTWLDVQYNTAETFAFEAQTATLTNISSGNIICNAAVVATYMTDLIITEYVEGSSNNKYLEIWNNTGSNVDLSDYIVYIYFNESNTAGSTINLAGTLNNQGNYVIANSSATVWGGAADLSSAVLNFNGNDAIVLANINSKGNVDVMGTIGSGTTFAENKTLRRNGDVENPSDTYISSQWTEYSTDVVSGLGNPGPLPIELANFYAKKEQNTTKLFWQTFSETNNSEFVLEKSNTIDNFIEFGRIKGAGNSNSILSYSFTDYTENDLKAYYRLKQIDYDGSFTFSNIITTSQTKNTTSIYIEDENIRIIGNIDNSIPANIIIYNANGQIVKEVKSSIDNINISNLSSGLYLLKIESNSIFKVYKFIKR